MPRRDALKILPQATTADSDFWERFHREAELASALWHPNIVQVHDRGEFDGQPMDRDGLRRGSRRRTVDEVPVPGRHAVGEVCDVVAAVAEALDYAHQRGLLHRDVKPANILVAGPENGERRILLADFGIARQHDDISGLTLTNTTVGTVAYSAPEQLMGDHIDGRADQYALAATAFHLLTGCPPYQHSSSVAVISRHLAAPPPRLADGWPGLAHLDQVMSRAMAKTPAERFDRCRDFAAALAERAAVQSHVDHRGYAGTAIDAPLNDCATHVAVPAPSPAAKPQRRKRFRILLAAALAAVVVTAVGVIGHLRQPTTHTAPVAASAPAGAPAPAPAASAPARPAALLDGTYRFEYDYAKQTINGAPHAINTTDNTAWWAFRSSCGSTGCAATATQLDTNNHQVARTPAQSANYSFADGHWQSAPAQRTPAGCAAAGSQLAESNQQEGTGTTSVLTFADGHWRGTPTLQASMGCQRTNRSGHDDETRLWSWDPQADGTLRGLTIGTILSNGCGTQGTVCRTPFTATRTGDVAPSVVVADPALFVTPTAPAPDGPH